MSSIVTTESSVTCPSCATMLVSQGLGFDQAVLCPVCHSTFLLRAPGFVVRTSRMAIISLILGIASAIGICLTGIPAIVLGILAMRSIRRGKGSLTGRGLAISGVATGCLLGFFCTPISLALILPAVQMFRLATEQAQSAAEREPGQTMERFSLENGLTVLLRPVAGAKQAALVVLYSVGGDQDPEGSSGLAHLVEHLYITSAAGPTPARRFEEFLQKYSAGWNAQTSDQFTVLATVFDKQSLDEEVQDAAARMRDLQVTAADLDREKRRLIEEVGNMFDGNAQLAALNRAREQVKPTPLGGRKGGLPEHVTSITLQAIQQRLERYYKPVNALVILAGDVDLAAARVTIENWFGSVPGGDPIPSPALTPEPQLGRIDEVRVKPIQLGAGAEVCVAYSAPAPDSELYPAFLVLAAQLSSRSQSLAVGPNRFPIQYGAVFDPFVLTISVPRNPGESTEQAVARLDKFVAATMSADRQPADLILAKNQFAFELETNSLPAIAATQNIYGVAFCAGRRAQLQIDSEALRKAIDSVEAEQLRQAAQRFFSPECRAAVVVTPQ